MKKLLVALLVFALVVPVAVASGPSPQGGPPPPPRGGIPPVGPKDLGGIPALDLTDRPMVEELAGMELSLEKRDRGQELVRSLTEEQRASVGQLLADNPLPVLGRVGEPVQPIQSVEELERHTEALKALLPELNRWRETMSAGLLRILTPEQYALYQDSLLPAPAQMAGVEPQTENDCYNEFVYAYYGDQYAYYAYLYAYYSYAYDEDLLSYDIYSLAINAYIYGYYGWVYAYYAYVYYCDVTYAYWAYYYNAHTEVLSYYLYNLAYEVYYMSGGTNALYAYAYSYYANIYFWYAAYYGYYCYQGGCNNPPDPPSNPSPAKGATGVSCNADLSWTGGDPDGDSVTYDVYFEANDSTPDNLICNDVSTPTCDPGTLASNTHYYWYVVATDNGGASTTGDTWDFTTGPCNSPPPPPSNPSPAKGATGVSCNACLSWTGGDPDGDSVTYDVYFEANDSTPDNLICNDVSSPSCCPDGLTSNTHYYWYVIATDEHGASTTGGTWDFTTSCGGCICTGMCNCDFEDGSACWQQYSQNGWPQILCGASSFPGDVEPHSGDCAVWEGGDDNEVCNINQNVTVPSGSPYLSYYHWIASQDSCVQPDAGQIMINNSVVKSYSLCSGNNTGGWVRGTVNLSSYVGQTVQLKFRVKTDSALNSNWFLDDICWSTTSSAETLPDIQVTDPAIQAPRPGAPREPSGQGDKPPVEAPAIEVPPPGVSPP